MSEIAPLSVLSVQDIIKRKDDLVIGVEDLKALAKRERYDTIKETIRAYNEKDSLGEFEKWLEEKMRSLTC